MKAIKYPLILIVSLIFACTAQASQGPRIDAEEKPEHYMTKMRRTRSGNITAGIYRVGSIGRRFQENFSEGSQEATQEIPDGDTKKRKRTKISRQIEIEPFTQEEVPQSTMEERSKKPKQPKRTVLRVWSSFDEFPQSIAFYTFKKNLQKATNRLTTIQKGATPSEDKMSQVQIKSADEFRVHIKELTSESILKHIQENLVSTTEGGVAREEFKRIVTELRDSRIAMLNNDVASLQEQGVSFEGGTYRDFSSHLEYFNSTIDRLVAAIDALADS